MQRRNGDSLNFFVMIIDLYCTNCGILLAAIYVVKGYQEMNCCNLCKKCFREREKEQIVKWKEEVMESDFTNLMKDAFRRSDNSQDK